MSNHWTNQFGGGRRPDLRSSAIGHGAWALCLIFGLLASAASALAAEIVEVRVGRHPTFTRVVFELDRAAGYRIEHSDPTADVAELVVSLEATSYPVRIQSKKTLIEQVEVEPSGRKSVARIRLSKGGLELKEMILSSPPRIVLDVMRDRPATGSVAATQPTPSPAPPAEETPPVREEPSFEDVVAQLPVEPEAPEPAPVVEPDPIPEPVVARVEAPVEPEPVVIDEPSTSTPVEELVPEAVALVEPTPPFVEPVQQRAPPPMVARTTPSTAVDQGGDWMNWVLAGIAGFVVLLGGLIVLRGRGRGEEADFEEEGAMDFGQEGQDDAPISASEQNPFEGLADGPQMTLGGADDKAGSPGMNHAAEADTMIASAPADEEKESESVFDDSEENVMDDMEVISRDQVNESLGDAMPPVGGIPEEFQQMMREMSRRVEALESRCDELVDARDRLERQVAAQTEELRVQRAAIARTQRAVRNLARPEDVVEDEATEPALRDPNQPS